MQQLLSGKKRFPAFVSAYANAPADKKASASKREFQELKWKDYRLGDLGKTYSGLTGKSKEDFGKGSPYIPYLNIFNNSRIDIGHFDYVSISPEEKQSAVRNGDIFFTASSETPDEVGMASVLLDNLENTYLNSFCFGFRLHNFYILLPEFARFYLRGQKFRKKI